MKIESAHHKPVPPQDLQQQKETVPPRPAVSRPEDKAFHVELSDTAGAALASRPTDEISQERVAAIRNQLAAGTYNISGKDVAKKMLDFLKN